MSWPSEFVDVKLVFAVSCQFGFGHEKGTKLQHHSSRLFLAYIILTKMHPSGLTGFQLTFNMLSSKRACFSRLPACLPAFLACFCASDLVVVQQLTMHNFVDCYVLSSMLGQSHCAQQGACEKFG
jgi:hypothetical protein